MRQTAAARRVGRGPVTVLLAVLLLPGAVPLARGGCDGDCSAEETLWLSHGRTEVRDLLESDSSAAEPEEAGRASAGTGACSGYLQQKLAHLPMSDNLVATGNLCELVLIGKRDQQLQAWHSLFY